MEGKEEVTLVGLEADAATVLPSDCMAVTGIFILGMFSSNHFLLFSSPPFPFTWNPGSRYQLS